MKNVILISIDTLRYDCVSYQPDKKELIKYDVLKHLETPTLDRIAEKSLCFTKCISTNSYTTSAHASILTGLYPPRHGVRGFYEKKLSLDVYTLAEVLKIFGYETVMMTDTANLFLPLGLSRGFDHFFHINDEGLLKFLDEKKDKRLFIFVHFYDAHEPFLLSKNPLYMTGEFSDTLKNLYRKFNLKYEAVGQPTFKNQRRAWLRMVSQVGYKSHEIFFPLYVRGVSRFDQGRFKDFMESIRSMGLLEDALTVIVADHGEGKSSPENPDDFTHGGKLYDSVIRVPLMIHHEDCSHRIINDTVSIVDVFPTIIDMASGEKADSLLPYSPDGISLGKDNGGGERFVYSENWGRDTRSFSVPNIFLSYYLDQRILRGNSKKFLTYGEPERVANRDAMQRMSDGEFVKNVYRGLLCRFEGFWEHARVLKDLEAKRITRDEFIQKVMRSLEYRSKDRHVMFDLERDPYEEKPVKMENGKGLPTGSEEFFETIKRISRDPAEAEDIFPEDRDAVIDIVKNVFKDEWKEKCDIFLDNKHLLTCLIEDFLVLKKIDTFDRNKKRVGDMMLASEEFGTFVRERLSAEPPKSFVIRKFISGHVSHRTLDKLYFLLLKLFPRETRRGRLWNKFLSIIMSN